MVKKLNEHGVLIKKLLEQGKTAKWIAKNFKFSRQVISYWKKTPLKTVQFRKTKLDDKEIDEIVKMAENKLTSNMGSKKIARIINNEFKKRGKAITISKDSICRYLKKRTVIRKLKKVFSLNAKQKEKRIKFCKEILVKGIEGRNIFFTDETKIDCRPFSNDYIRLSYENNQKLKKGDLEAYKMVNKESSKFPKRIIVAGGISYYGLSDLICVEGTINEFAYAQTLLYYKKNMDSFNKNIILEQDVEGSHTSKSNINLLNKLFGEQGWIAKFT